MTATYSSSLRLEKQGVGDNSDTWGTRLNLGVIDLVDAAVASARAITLTGNYVLTTSNGGDEDARAAMLVFSGTAGAVNVTMPTQSKTYLVYNGSNGVVTMKMASGATVAVPSLGTRWVYSDATNVKDGLADYLTSVTAATTYQPLSTFLTNLSNLGTTGIDVRTNAATVVSRTLAAPAAGFTIASPDGVAGNPTFVLANDLAAVEALASNGIVTRTASETWTTRTITGTANEITATNGDGVAGAPTLSLPTALTFTGKTVTGGTFASPTLSGTMTGGTVNPTTLQQASVTVGTAAFQNTGTSGANLPFLNGANTWSGVQTLSSKALNEAKGANVASAASCDIWTPGDGNFVHITGVTTITSFATAPQAGATRIVTFDGILTLTNNANIVLPGGADITTAAGDLGLIVADTTTKVLLVVYQRAATVAGKIAQVVTTESGASSTGTTILPTDDTVPQNTEGDQFMTVAITPTNASSTLVINVVFFGVHSGSTALSIALFQDTTANALAATSGAIASNGATLALTHKMTAGTTSATTFKVRAGGSVGGTTTFNGIGGSRVFGGVAASSIVITEVTP